MTDSGAMRECRAVALQVKKLSRIGVFVRDLGRAEKFYVEVLGLEPLRRVARIEVILRGGGVEVGLYQDAERAPADDGSALAHPERCARVTFELTYGEMTRAAEALEEAKAGFRGPVEIDEGLSVFVEDPDGNLIELRTPPPETPGASLPTRKLKPVE